MAYVENALLTPRFVPCAHTPSTTWRFLVAVENGGSRLLPSLLRATSPSTNWQFVRVEKGSLCILRSLAPARKRLQRIGSFFLLSKTVARSDSLTSRAQKPSMNWLFLLAVEKDGELLLCPHVPLARKRLPRNWQFLLPVGKGGLRLRAVRVQLRPPTEPRDGLGSVLRWYFGDAGGDHGREGRELYDLPHLPLGRHQRHGLHIFVDVSVR